MSEEENLPLPDAASLVRGRFIYFPVAPGGWNSASKRGRRYCVNARM